MSVREENWAESETRNALRADESRSSHAVVCKTYDARGNGDGEIVRRLTPTECARLQGFPDKWGHPDRKDDLTDEEYAFWIEVRCTHAIVNGKEPKTYSKEQMLNWYNKLHTDSAEYKMWGNGIALPTALYCMQGIAESFCKEVQDERQAD